jgi:hypothetical protein
MSMIVWSRSFSFDYFCSNDFGSIDFCFVVRTQTVFILSKMKQKANDSAEQCE